ncbi:AAEL001114-PA [Aedes aegypti]|uniref:AAEL001114-PA n=2 Tax=Aedes aegypti TaxID=7159 RepID=A0A1S4EXU8_AEDAE|nr:putative sodium-coupled neutral amino acid transporter 10 [Aedes aegypti]EAT47780.1 AAEL001114-PA [Aedes aegypti]
MERNSVQTVTLMNSIIGVGILSMPFCFQKCGVVLSLVLLLLSTYITKLVCSYMIKSAIIARRKTFEQIAFYAFGSCGKLLVELCVVGYLLGTCIAYFVVVGDLGPQIAAKMLAINESSTLRTWVMIVVTAVCIIPLGLLRNVDSLSTVCTASLGFYVCLILKVMAESSEQISKAGWFDRLDMWKTEGILQCLPIISMALSCQMQLFEVYATMPTTSLDKMSRVIQKSTSLCACIYGLIGFFGYVAFNGHQFSGNILVNFSPSYVSDIIKIGFVLSVAFSFPLAIFPCRVSLYSLLYKKTHSDAHMYIPESKFRPLTVAIVCTALVLGWMVPSIEVVIGLVGSTIGVAVCIIIPAACYMHICKTNISEKQLAQVMIVFGFFIMILGTYANLEAMNRVPEKKYETGVKEDVVLAPVVNVEKPEESLDKKFEELRPKLPVLPEAQKEVPVVTENIAPKIEEPVTVKPVKVEEPIFNKDKEDKSVVSPDPQEPDNQKDKKDEIIDQDAILKEEKEIAVEEKEQIQKEIIELQSAKKELEAQVENIKEQLVKKNEETQQLVLKKFDEIVEKIDQKVSKEKDEPKPEPAKESSPDLQKDPIVRLLTEQGKLNAKANETTKSEPAKPEAPLNDDHASEMKLSVDEVANNETANETEPPPAEIHPEKEEKSEPLPPLPVEQKKEPESSKSVEPEEPKPAKSDDAAKESDDAGSKRDLLSVRNKRNTGKVQQSDEVSRTGDDANCRKVNERLTMPVALGDKVVSVDHDLIGQPDLGLVKDKIVNMIRRDVLLDDGKLFK